MFDRIVRQSWDGLSTTCNSAAFTFWGDAMLVVLFAMSAAVIVLLGPSWLRGARALFVEDRCNG